MKLLRIPYIIALVQIFIACSGPSFHFEILETGCYNLVRGEDPFDSEATHARVIIPVQMENVKKGNVSLTITAEDLRGNPVAIWNDYFDIEVRGHTSLLDTSLFLNLPNGFYRIQTVAVNRQRTDTAYTEIGILPPSENGLRPNSFFASNTSEIKTGKDLDLLALLGIKVQRTHFYPETKHIPHVGLNKSLQFDYDSLDRVLNASTEKGIWVLPIAGYAFPGTRSEKATAMNMHGPPRHIGEFTKSWTQIIQNYPGIRVYELWNEPWIYEWTWAANAEKYRTMQEIWCNEMLQTDPGLRIIAGNSCMFVEDHIEPYPQIWKGLIHGTSHHPYANAEARSLRHNAQIRSIDYGYLVNKRMGLPYYYLTEGGTLYNLASANDHTRKQNDLGKGYNNNPNATKAVQYNVTAALHGCYQSNIQWNLGYGPDWTRSNTTLSVCTYFLEDKPVVAEIWPGSSLITGAVFADPRHIDERTRSLPRSEELSARWEEYIPEDARHRDMKVAVIYTLTGPSNDSLDKNGRLRIRDHFSEIRAFDCTGKELRGSEKYLEVPLSEYPVYLVTEDLEIYDFHRAISGAEIYGITTLNMYATSLTMSPEAPQLLHIRTDNHLNHELEGYLVINNLGSVIGESVVNLNPGLNELFIPAREIKMDNNGMIPLHITLHTSTGTFEHKQVIQRAMFANGSRIVDGKLDDWQDVDPVTIDSESSDGGIDMTRYLFNPNLEKPGPGTQNNSQVAARIYTSYDKDFVYIAAEILEDTLLNEAGKKALKNGIDTGYRLGMPGGLTHPRYTGDCLLLGFGFRDRVPVTGRQMDDPLAWKGHFYDTDYLYLAYPSTEGEQLIRQWGADTRRLNGFQTDPVEHIEQVSGSEISIQRDEERGISIYEMAIPRKELNLFSENDSTLRFGFIIANNEGAGTSGKLEWSSASGVFDYWLNTGSYAPTWDQNLPCQTFFGIAKQDQLHTMK